MTAKQRKSVEKALETMRDGVATLYLNGGDPGIGDTGAARLAGLLPDSELISMSLIDNEIGARPTSIVLQHAPALLE